MFQRSFVVKYVTSKTSFCALSVNNLKLLNSNCIVVNTSSGGSNYLSVEPNVAFQDDNAIGINSLYGKMLKIAENSTVIVSSVPQASTCRTATITALNQSDHEILELVADNVQSTLLSQIRLIWEQQRFIIWIGSLIHVGVEVSDVKPFSPAWLDNFTEIIVKPPETRIGNVDEDINIPRDLNNSGMSKYMNPLRDNLILRVVPNRALLEIENCQKVATPFSVFISKKSLRFELNENTVDKPYIYKIEKIKDPDVNPNAVFVRLYVVEDLALDFNPRLICADNVFVSDSLVEHLKVNMGSRVSLVYYIGETFEIDEIEIFLKKRFAENVEEAFRQFLADNCKSGAFILNKNAIFEVSPRLRCFLKFNPPKPFALITQDLVRTVKLISFNENMPEKELFDVEEIDLENYVTDVGNYQEIIDKSLFLFVFNTKPFTKMYNVLITGKSGSGKTSLLSIIQRRISEYPNFIYTKQLNCKTIKGKTVESLHKYFTGVLFELIHHQPSVLILDDLHVLCENVNEADALAQNALYYNRVSEMLEGLMQTFCEHNCIGLLATATSTMNLNNNIYASRGNTIFRNILNIDDLIGDDRRKLLAHLFRASKLQGVDLSHLAAKTESFVVRDLVDFVHKAHFESYTRNYNQTTVLVKPDDCEKALENVTSTALQAVKLSTSGDKDLSDIGGLEKAKSDMIEILYLPTKYPKLFLNAPLRLPSGLLLYGPPGSGKTILAGAAAKHCGLRLISVKGPELLSKYIGASEQAVRDVFQRAQQAKPCVIFFDEFDSLAPRRGHDNTGVTDRVVNQLLTQLDGVETISGVFVLAATSRPDLLDPALLRPGRLDKHILCPLPDTVARLSILQALSKTMNFAEDVDLGVIAGKSDNFSGADLQAVLYSAQLDSVKNLLAENEVIDHALAENFVTQKHLLEALKNTKPSLSLADRLNYNKIFKEFEGETGLPIAAGSKVTLA